MNKIYRLTNQIKNYEWGSVALMPEFLGIKNLANTPYAEMWMGTHEGAPSQVECYDSGGAVKKPLKEITGSLPFLFKLLAVEKPLSIQAHPGSEKARQGFQLEEEVGLELKSPKRNYKDPNPKPELLCALSEFSLMAGFREISEIKKLLIDLTAVLPQLKEIITPLQQSLNTDSLAVFLRIIFNLSKIEREYICEMILNKNINKGDVITQSQWDLIKKIASMYPSDPAILSPLYLNYFTIRQGEAVYLPPGVLHSYVSGFGVEIMTASDNVLRGGLTPKYIDIPELMNVLDFKPFMPVIQSPPCDNECCNYSVPCPDFSLSFYRNNNKKIAVTGPAICLVTDGMLELEDAVYKKGESFFINKDSREIFICGNFCAFLASSGITS